MRGQGLEDVRGRARKVGRADDGGRPCRAGGDGRAAAGAVAYDWSSVRIGGGGFTPGIVFSTVEPGLAYLRSDMGGAYRWDAHAKSWVQLQDGVSEGSYMGVESLAVDPVDAGTVYLAAGMAARMPSAIFRSTDYGAHWQVTPVPSPWAAMRMGAGWAKGWRSIPSTMDGCFSARAIRACGKARTPGRTGVR
jgi:hypothetical protein